MSEEERMSKIKGEIETERQVDREWGRDRGGEWGEGERERGAGVERRGA